MASIRLGLKFLISFTILINSSIIKKYKSSKEIESHLLPLLSKKKLLQSFEHKGYFYGINDKKELITAKKKLKKL